MPVRDPINQLLADRASEGLADTIADPEILRAIAGTIARAKGNDRGRGAA